MATDMALDFNLANGQNRQSIIQSVLAGRQRMRTNQARDLLQQAAKNPEQRPELLSQALALDPRAAATAQGFYHNQAVDRQNAELLANKQQQMAAAHQADVHTQRLTNLHGIYGGIIQTAKAANRKGKDGLGMMDAYFQQVRPDLVKLVGEMGGDPSKIPMHYDKRMMPHFLAGYTKTGAAIGKETVPGGNELRGNRFVTTRPGQVIFDKVTGKPVFTNTNPQFAPRAATSGSPSVGGISPKAIENVPDAVKNAVAMSVLTGGNVNYLAGYGKTSNPARYAGQERAANILKAANLTMNDLPMLKGSAKARQSALRAVAKKGQVINAYMNALDGSVAKLKKAAADFGLDKLPAVNWANIRAKRWSGDPKVAAYQQAMYEVQANLGRVLSGSTGAAATTESAMKTAMDRLPEYSSPSQLSSNLDQIEKDAHILSNAFNKQAGLLRRSLNVMNLGKKVGSSTGNRQRKKNTNSNVPKNYMKYLEQ